MKLNEFKTVLPYLAKAEIVPLIVGESGVGKTESVKQFAQENGYRFINIRLGQMADAGDLTGLPDFVEVDGVKMTAFLQPNFFPKKGEKAVVFFDEINRCHPDLIQAVFQAVERDGGIGEYKFDMSVDTETGLPNTIKVSASNPLTDDYTVNDISDKAFLNRFCHLKFEPSTQEALDYYEKIGVEASIRKFLAETPNMLEVEGERFSLDYVKPTRRTWEGVHRFLKTNPPKEIINEVMMGLIGVEATTSYQSFMKNWDIILKGEDVIKKFKSVKDKIQVDRVDVLNNTCNEILAYLKENDVTKKQAQNIVDFALYVPRDIGVNLIFNILKETDKNGDLLMKKKFIESEIASGGSTPERLEEFTNAFKGLMKVETSEE